MENYYEILAVRRGASTEEIKKSYRRLSKLYHPDINPNDKAAVKKFAAINAAYTILCNPKLRKEYDEKLCFYAPRRNDPVEEQPRRQRHHSSPDAFNINNARYMFEQFFGFDPKNNKTNQHFTGKSHAKKPSVNPYIFEGFFDPKKK